MAVTKLNAHAVVMDNTAPDFAQHLTTDINDALSHLSGDLTDTISAVVDTITADITTLTTDLGTLTTTVSNIVSSTGWVKIQSQPASGAATVDFTIGIDGTYDQYMITCTDVMPGTNTTEFWVRVSEDAGATWKSGASAYRWAYLFTSDLATNVSVGDTADSGITLTSASLSTTAENALNGIVRFFNPSSTTTYKGFIGDFESIGAGGNYVRWIGSGRYLATAAINGVRIMTSSGTISGTFTLYGLTK